MRLQLIRHALVGIALATVAVAVTWSGPVLPAAANPGTVVSIDPPTKSVAPGESFELQVVVDTDQATKGIQFALTFNPAHVEVLEVTEGPYYKDFAASHGLTTMNYPKPKIDADAGKMTDWGFSLMGRKPDAPTGRGTVAIIKLRAKGAGESEIVLTNVVVSGVSPTNPDEEEACPNCIDDYLASANVTSEIPELKDVTVQGAKVAVGGAVSDPSVPTSQGGSHSQQGDAGGTAGSGVGATSSQAKPAATTATGDSAAAGAASSGQVKASSLFSTPADPAERRSAAPGRGGLSLPWGIVGGFFGAVIVGGVVTTAVRKNVLAKWNESRQ